MGDRLGSLTPEWDGGVSQGSVAVGGWLASSTPIGVGLVIMGGACRGEKLRTNWSSGKFLSILFNTVCSTPRRMPKTEYSIDVC